VRLEAKLRWKAHLKKEREEVGLKYKKMYWLMGRRSALSLHNKQMVYKQILKPVWAYGLQLGVHETAILISFNDFKTSYLGTSLMHLGVSEKLTSIGTFKWRWLRTKLESSLKSMKKGFSTTSTSKRFSC